MIYRNASVKAGVNLDHCGGAKIDQLGGEKADPLGWGDGFFGVFVGPLERSLRTPFRAAQA